MQLFVWNLPTQPTRAVSKAGGQGPVQLMPATAARLNVNSPFNPADNIDGGSRYLRHLLTLFDNNYTLALAAYNAGENAVMRYGNKIPPTKKLNTTFAKYSSSITLTKHHKRPIKQPGD